MLFLPNNMIKTEKSSRQPLQKPIPQSPADTSHPKMNKR